MKHILFIVLPLFIPILLFAYSWEYKVDKNVMTGEKSIYASSPATLATKKIDFPYSKTKSWIGIGCKDEKKWAYFGFSTAPNLSGTTTEDGYHVIKARIKIDDKLENIKLTQKWGSKFLYISSSGHYSLDADAFITKIKKANSALLELDWHGNGNTYFSFSLKGSAKALSEMQNKCKLTHLASKACKNKDDTYIKVDHIDGCVEIKPYEDEFGNDVIRSISQLTKEEKCMLLGGYIDTSNNICKIWKKKESSKD